MAGEFREPVEDIDTTAAEDGKHVELYVMTGGGEAYTRGLRETAVIPT